MPFKLVRCGVVFLKCTESQGIVKIISTPTSLRHIYCYGECVERVCIGHWYANMFCEPSYKFRSWCFCHACHLPPPDLFQVCVQRHDSEISSAFICADPVAFCISGEYNGPVGLYRCSGQLIVFQSSILWDTAACETPTGARRKS